MQKAMTEVLRVAVHVRLRILHGTRPESLLGRRRGPSAALSQMPLQLSTSTASGAPGVLPRGGAHRGGQVLPPAGLQGARVSRGDAPVRRRDVSARVGTGSADRGNGVVLFF